MFFFIVLAIACVVFWRVALRFLAAAALLLLVAGAVTLIQHLNHIIR